MSSDRQARRATFEVAAQRYDRARPEYPDALFEEMLRLTGTRSGDRVLEVGCATGTATRPLAERGLHITCVELGAELAALARQQLAACAAVEVVCAAFETWTPNPDVSFDRVLAATAWHWIDPDVRYRKAWEVLRPGGHLAFWSATHVMPEHGDPFFAEVQDVYDDIGEGLPAGAVWPAPGELPDDRAEIEKSGLFEEVAVRQFDWEVVYDAQAYIDLLETFSGHIAMQAWQRERLYGEIRTRLAARADGRVRRHWGSVLHTARRIA
ncbi:MAG: methyltransferase domain-containing protein [Candidatus Dormibacteraeota bacterium]|uniref:Methyltransferase domain-containing protein n=1 Tax=Candidatus Amunia macphersoniae TaxID=3127014 RepID=A0A934NJL7_9BACT|nr:methyltransferase domain-containing protein [Candidatus Dormibacteraeota bacterium]